MDSWFEICQLGSAHISLLTIHIAEIQRMNYEILSPRSVIRTKQNFDDLLRNVQSILDKENSFNSTSYSRDILGDPSDLILKTFNKFRFGMVIKIFRSFSKITSCGCLIARTRG